MKNFIRKKRAINSPFFRSIKSYCSCDDASDEPSAGASVVASAAGASAEASVACSSLLHAANDKPNNKAMINLFNILNFLKK